MLLIYNSIALKMLSLETYRAETVYDETGTDYLYTKYFISGNFVVNGQAEIQGVTPTTTVDRDVTVRPQRTESAMDLRPPAVPAGVVPPAINIAAQPLGVQQTRTVAGGGPPDPFTEVPPTGVYSPVEQKQYKVLIRPVPAYATIQSVEFLLNTPRGKLFVYTGDGDESVGEVLLRSPRDWSLPVDAANGPKPRAWNVVESIGNIRTMLCNFQIETCLNFANRDGVGGVGPLLSNRFSMRHTMSADSFMAIEVEGNAIFNTEYLYSGVGLSPDTFRTSLMLPVPFGFTREALDVQGYPDGTGFRYEFRDVQRPVHLPAAPYVNAADVECTFRQIVNTDTDILGGALNIYERGLSLLVNTRFANGDPDRTGRRRRKRKPRPKPPAGGTP